MNDWQGTKLGSDPDLNCRVLDLRFPFMSRTVLFCVSHLTSYKKLVHVHSFRFSLAVKVELIEKWSLLYTFMTLLEITLFKN